jgi:hypothetical protein
VAQVGDNLKHFQGVGARGCHPLLGLAHLGPRDHLHGLGDLLRAFDAGDLGSDFFGAGHVF